MATAGGERTEDARTRSVPVTITRHEPATAVVTPTMKRARISEEPLVTPKTPALILREVPPPPPLKPVTTSPTQREISAALAQPKAWSPDRARQPSSDVIAENRDRFKIRLPGGGWLDAYGRLTSLRRKEKSNHPRPSPSVTGLLVSIHHLRPPIYVAVDRHLPTGWGRIHTPDGQKHRAYKETSQVQRELC